MDLEQHFESQIFQSLVAFNFDHRHHHNIRSSPLNGCIDSCSLRMTSFHTILRIDIIKFSIRFNNQQTLYTDIFPSVSLYILFGEHWQSFLVAIHIPLKSQQSQKHILQVDLYTNDRESLELLLERHQSLLLIHELFFHI